jgi:hypothetical protein
VKAKENDLDGVPAPQQRAVGQKIKNLLLETASLLE